MRAESWNPLVKSYPDSEKVNAVSLGAEVLYTRLIAQTDDANHYYGDPQWILARLFTARHIAGQVSIADITQWLGELERTGLIVRYRADGQTYLELLDAKKLFRGDVRKDIRFPLRRGSETN